MKIIKNNQMTADCDTIIIPIDGKFNITCPLSENVSAVINAAIKSNLFKGSCGEIYTFSSFQNSKILNILLLGLGEDDKAANRDIFIAFSKAFSACKSLKSINIRVLLDNAKNICSNYSMVEKICESTLLANYEFNNYKTDAKENTVERIEFETSFERFDEALNEAMICGESTIIARNLINQPPMVMTPAQLAEEAKMIGKEYNIQVIAIGKEEAEKLGMNAFLAVGKGSVNTPKLIVMR